VELVEQLRAVGGQSATAEVGLDREATRWMADAATGGNLSYAVEAVAWAAALPDLAGAVSSTVWWNLLEHLVRLSVEAAAWPVEESPLVHQLLAGELALTLAYGLPEIAACRELACSARESLSAGMIELLDGEGLPRAENMPLLRPLVACWTRCQALGRHWREGCFIRSAAGQFDWAVRQALRWTRADGTPVLGESSDAASFAEMLAAALVFDRDKDDQQIAAVVLPRKRKSHAVRPSRSSLPEASSHSDWSRAGVLRGQWSHRGPCLSVLYPDKTLRTELGVRSEVLWSGPWEVEVRRDGNVLAPTGGWEETCWVSDEDADFLELEIQLAGGARIERQMVMAHDDRLLLVADAVLGEQPGRLQYVGRLPLRPDVSAGTVPDSPELILRGRRPAARVLPLALPEWPCDKPAGALSRTAAGLELCQRSEGRSMYCPLLVDLDPRRWNRPRTWRHLTVAASMEIQPADVAVGYRVQIGRRQWLIYRSLAEIANRTLLGHNLSSETLFARFHRSGDVEQLIEVE